MRVIFIEWEMEDAESLLIMLKNTIVLLQGILNESFAILESLVY